MLVELIHKGERNIEYMFTVDKKSDIGNYFIAEFTSVKSAKVTVGNILTLTGTFSSPIVFNMKVVKKFHNEIQAPGCTVLDLMGGPQYCVKTFSQVPPKFYTLGGNQESLARYANHMADWITSWGINVNMSLVQQCADTYVLETLYRDYPDVMDIQIKFHDHVRRLSRQFANYLDMVIGGEARHANGQANYRDLDALLQRSNSHKVLVNVLRGIHEMESNPCDDCEDVEEDEDENQLCNHKTCAKYKKLKKGSGAHNMLGNREIMWNEWHALRQKYGLPLLEAVNDLFNECHWGSSFGGSSWGSMSKALLRYHRKEYAPEDAPAWRNSFHFIDDVWSLQHNGGYALNKVWVVPGVLVKVLDYKFAGNTDKLVRYASKEVIETWAKRTGQSVKIPTRISDLD